MAALPVRTVRMLSSLVLVVLGTSCTARPSFALGSDCELATECATPLVCRLGRCREECRSDRDCRAGLVCFREDTLGACELEEESCVLSSDCPEPLVCLMSRCTNACETDVDCSSGARCIALAGVLGCRDTFEMECEFTSQCGPGLICTPDLRCRPPCVTDRDCRDGTVCDEAAMPHPVCVFESALDGGTPADTGPPMDVGPIDAPGLDGGPGTDAPLDGDAGAIDAAMSDAGLRDAGPPDAGVMTGPAPAPMLASGYQHTCGVHMASFRCWGSNNTGQLGDNTTVDHNNPAAVLNVGSGVTLAAAGAGHACAASTSGLWCWGDNLMGQVGDGGAGSMRSSPLLIAGAPATSLACGRAHTCAIRASVLSCWGENSSGQIGDGTVMPRRVPTSTLALLAAPVEVTARASQTCVVLVDGRVQCWGDNTFGQLGNGTATPLPTPTPQLVVSLTNAVEVVTGSDFACARRRDGSVSCWGSNALGTLGDGSTFATVRATPGPVSGLPPAVELAAGTTHACARVLDGRIFCWGGNALGQVGVNNLVPDTREEVPREVLGVSGATELSAGDLHSCARVASGLLCWGSNSRGQLGDGGTLGSFTPRSVNWP